MKKVNKKNRYAVWIDQRKAILLSVDAAGNLMKEEIESSVGKRERFSGEETSKTGALGKTLTRETTDQHRKENHFHAFLKDIVAKLNMPEGLLILGPGDARHELQNEVEKVKALEGLRLENRPADKMAEHELKAAMNDFFHLS